MVPHRPEMSPRRVPQSEFLRKNAKSNPKRLPKSFWNLHKGVLQPEKPFTCLWENAEKSLRPMQRAWHMDNWTIAHASCTMTQPPSLATCVNILAAPCRIRVACGLRRSMRRILRRILWRIFWRISRRILRRIFLAYPHSGLEEAGVANFPLKPTPGTNPWNEPLAEGLGLAFSRPTAWELRSSCAEFLHKSQTRCRILGQLVLLGCLPHPTLCQGSVLWRWGAFGFSFPRESAITKRMTKYRHRDATNPKKMLEKKAGDVLPRAFSWGDGIWSFLLTVPPGRK